MRSMRIEGSTDWYGLVRSGTEWYGVPVKAKEIGESQRNREKEKITFFLFLYYGVLLQKRQESCRYVF